METRRKSGLALGVIMSIITVRVEKNNTNNVTLTVEDNDIGIKPEKPEKLFQKFYQIDGATKRHVGHRAWFGDMQRHRVRKFGSIKLIRMVLQSNSL